MEQLILNLVPGGVSPVCYVSQYDVGRKIRLHLRNGSDPYVLSGAETVTATIRKVSGEELIYDIANTSASYVDMIVNYDATDVIGESVCELVITQSGTRLGSANFKMRIDPDVYSGDQKLEVVSATSETPDLSFETNVEENLLELKAGFSPVQDLHGYDHPWAGGAGKNKFDFEGWLKSVNATYTKNGNSYTFNTRTNSRLFSEPFIFSDDNISLALKSTITIPEGSTATTVGFELLNTNNYNVFDARKSEGTGNACKIRLNWSAAGDVTITEPMVVFSNTIPTSFEPYENICPIEGWNEVNVTHCGANLYDNIYAHYRRPVNYLIKDIPLEIGKTYTLKATLKSGGAAVTGCYVGVAGKGEQYSEFISMTPCVKVDGTTMTQTFIPTNSWTSPKLIIYDSGNENLFNSLFENYEIQLTQGSTPTEYKPYTEKLINLDWNTNQWDEELEIGEIDVNTGAPVSDRTHMRSKNYTPCFSSKEYFCIDPTSNYNIMIFFYDKNKNYMSRTNWLGSQTFATPENACYLKFKMGAQYGTTYNHDISINYPSTDHTYHPYKGHGVAYAGEVIYKDGGWKLRLLSKEVDLGDLNYSYNSTYHRFDCPTDLGAKPAPDNVTPANAICSCYRDGCVNDVGVDDGFFYIAPPSGNGKLRIVDSRYSDIATFKAAVSGNKLVYELATPIEIPLDQNSKLATVLGINNLMHDANGGTEVKFFRMISAS